jgi:hypothetical protein
MSDQRLYKAYEVALVCAAQDGLEPGEILSVADSVMSVPILTQMSQQFFAEDDEIDLMESIGLLPELLGKMEEFEIMQMDDDYISDAASTIGESPAIQNICLAMCILFSASDGEVSGAEGNAIQVVAENLPAADIDMAQTLVQKILELSQEFLDGDDE